MDEAREMYQEHILENYKDPMNFGTIDNPTNKKRELNPLCGDDITIQLIIKEILLINKRYTLLELLGHRVQGKPQLVNYLKKLK